MTANAETALPARRPPVRLWLVSLLLFAGGFVGKLVLEGGGRPGQGYPVVVLWQIGWYAAGLVTWFVWWSATGARKWGWVGAAMAVFAVIAACSSSPK